MICAAKPKALAIDFIFDTKTSKDAVLLNAIKTASCPIVLGAAAPPIKQTAKQKQTQGEFLKEAGRPYGYLNVATEPDGVVRVQGEPEDSKAVPLSFAEAAASASRHDVHHEMRRISWLRSKAGVEPFTTIPAYFLLPGLNKRKEGAAGANRPP